MSHIEELLAKNSTYRRRHIELGLIPKYPTIVITCMDARTAPEHFLGIESGEALVIRNMGGRVTPEVEYQIGAISHIITSNGGQLPEILIIHHTDCGMQRLHPEIQQDVSEATGIPTGYLASVAITSPAESLTADVAALEASAYIPSGMAVRTVMYEVVSGEATPL